MCTKMEKPRATLHSYGYIKIKAANLTEKIYKKGYVHGFLASGM